MSGSQLAPGFLVASPSLECPFFNHTLVLLVEHSDEGSFGFVVNRPTEVRFRQVLGEVGLEIDAAGPPEALVMLGGPVSPETGWILYDPSSMPGHAKATDEDRAAGAERGDANDGAGDGSEEEMVRVSEHLALSASMGMLEKLAAGDGPSRRIMLLGYAGWGKGQLEQEMRDGAWIPVDLDAGLVFDAPVDDRWTLALGKLGIDPARVSGKGVASA